MRYIYFVIIFSSVANPAFSSEGVVPFRARVGESCTIEVTGEGAMARDGLTALDSAVPGGRSGTATVYTTGQGFQISLKAPEAFVTSPGGAGPVTFWSKYRITGATSVSETSGAIKTRLQAGANQMSVDLRAMANNVVIEKGDYEAYVTLTCE